MDDAEHLHVGIDRFQHPFADGLFGHLGDELFDDRIADVGFEQGPFDELHAVAHVRFGEFSLAAQRFDGAFEAFFEGFEHGNRIRAESEWNNLRPIGRSEGDTPLPDGLADGAKPRF